MEGASLQHWRLDSASGFYTNYRERVLLASESGNKILAAGPVCEMTVGKTSGR